MRGLLFFIILLAIAIIIIAPFIIFTMILRQRDENARKNFVKRQREAFQKRYPALVSEEFTPLITHQSLCCSSMIWLTCASAEIHLYCDKCGKQCNMHGELLKNGKNLNELNQEAKEEIAKWLENMWNKDGNGAK